MLEDVPKAQLCGGMGAGAEGLSRVDDDWDQPFIRLLPRRAHPQLANANRPMELPPSLGPSCLHVARGARTENLPEPLLAARLRIGGEFDPPVERDLLESLREQLDQDGPGLLRALGGDADGNSAEERIAQRNAALSFSKKPSSGL
jgi:hypothetical protein